MSANDYDSLLSHVGHAVAVVAYGEKDEHGVIADPVNVAVECEDCSIVLLDYERP